MSKKIIAILMALVCIVTLSSSVSAESASNYIDLQSYNDVYRLSEDSEVSLPFIKVFNDKAIFDRGISSSGLSIASKSVEIDESLSGVQTLISADTVDIKGSIEYGIIFASNVVISGTIEKDVLVIAESIFVTETANIGGDMVVVAGTMELKGNVEGNFIASASKLLVLGNVAKDFRVASSEIEINEPNIEGKIYIETNSELNISDKYPESVVKKLQTNTVTKEEKKIELVNKIVESIIGIILFVLLNLVVGWIRPNLFKDLTYKFSHYSSYAVIAGTLGIVTIPIIAMVLMLASMAGVGIVTIPLLIVYIALMVVIISLAKFITGSVIIEMLREKLKLTTKLKEMLSLTVIYAVIYLLCNISFIGWFATMATVLVSSAVVVTGLTRKKN